MLDVLTDFRQFSRSFLKVKNKRGILVPFVMNEAQEYAYSRLEQQKKDTGMVRAVVLKSRQQGLSTLIEGRFFHQTVTKFGVSTLILTHEQSATDNLFAMTNRYLDNYPAQLRPALGASNAKELIFSKLDSSFRVATAGNKGAGRSLTAHLLHNSEVAFWPNAKEHLAGIMQTIPNEPGTEIIYESTANGIGNVFHTLFTQGEENKGGLISIFVPWFWQHEYRCEGIKIDDEDREYGELFDLDSQQMMWRRRKIEELGGDLTLFMREYPSTPAEAFSVSSEKSLIQSRLVQLARKAEIEVDRSAPRVLGVDPARLGADSTSIVLRQGRNAEIVGKFKGKDTMQVVGELLLLYNKYNPDAIFIDLGGIGGGIYDRLRELNVRGLHSVNFGGTPLNKARFFNKRAEMWGLMHDWLASEAVSIEDSDALEIDLCGLQYSYDSSGKLKLEKKEDAKERGIKSPDDGDALALTFAMPISKHTTKQFNSPIITIPGFGG